MGGYRRALLPGLLYCALWLPPGFGAAINGQQAKGDSQSTGLRKAAVGSPTTSAFALQCATPVAPQTQGGATPTKVATCDSQGRLEIDPELAQSLVKNACAIHAHADTDIPFAATLNLPAGPYQKTYGTKSRTRIFGIVGDDCDYLSTPHAPSARMLVDHRMDDGFIYIALLNARGNVLALLHQTGPADYRHINTDHGLTTEMTMIYADLKSETESWNKALIRLLQNQTAQEQQAPEKGKL